MGVPVAPALRCHRRWAPWSELLEIERLACPDRQRYQALLTEVVIALRSGGPTRRYAQTQFRRWVTQELGARLSQGTDAEVQARNDAVNSIVAEEGRLESVLTAMMRSSAGGRLNLRSYLACLFWRRGADELESTNLRHSRRLELVGLDALAEVASTSSSFEEIAMRVSLERLVPRVKGELRAADHPVLDDLLDGCRPRDIQRGRGVTPGAVRRVRREARRIFLSLGLTPQCLR